MPNQINPNIYSTTCRCPLEDASILWHESETAGITMNECIALLIKKHVEGKKLNEEMLAWIQERRASNIAARERRDKEVAEGKYRAKKPKKRGRPPKAKKRGRPAKKIRKTRSDKGIPRGPRNVLNLNG